MPVVIIMLAAAYLSARTIVTIVALLAFCKFIAKSRSSCLHLHYSKDNKLYKEFIERSNIASLKFEPYIFAPTATPQGIFYLLSESF